MRRGRALKGLSVRAASATRLTNSDHQPRDHRVQRDPERLAPVVEPERMLRFRDAPPDHERAGGDGGNGGAGTEPQRDDDEQRDLERPRRELADSPSAKKKGSATAIGSKIPPARSRQDSATA